MNEQRNDDEYEIDEYGQIHRPYTEPEDKQSLYGYDPYDEPIKQTFCIIATTVYGDPHCEEVEILRQWRDRVLRPTVAGRAFIDFYYCYGRWGANLIHKVKPFEKLTKFALDKFVAHLIGPKRKGNG